MNILIIHAHENERSFTSALMRDAVSYFEKKGDNVVVSDLYKLGFDPVLSKDEFTKPTDEPHYLPQKEQLNASNIGGFPADVLAEMDKVSHANLLIFNFPLWWFSMPAIMKGWVDRVFAMGFAYSIGRHYEKGLLYGKSAMCTVTTGGPEITFTKDGANGAITDLLYHVHHGMFYFTGMRALPPYVAYAPHHRSRDERLKLMYYYRKHLDSLETVKPLYAPIAKLTK